MHVISYLCKACFSEKKVLTPTPDDKTSRTVLKLSTHLYKRVYCTYPKRPPHHLPTDGNIAVDSKASADTCVYIYN